MTDNRFCIDYAKRQAGCKKCKQKMEKGELRIAKITASPFSDDGEMKNYHHPACIFDTFKKVRATTKVIEDPSDLEGWSDVQKEDKDLVMNLIKEQEQHSAEKQTKKATPKKSPTPKNPKASPAQKTPKKTTTSKKKGEADIKESNEEDNAVASSSTLKREPVNPGHKDNNFREFRRLCSKIAETPGYLDKTAIVEKYLNKGTGGDKFQGDLQVWVRLLLPGVVKRVYNMQSKQMVKVFSRIFSTNEEEMIDDLAQGDVAETIGNFFEQSSSVTPPKKSDLTVHDIDNYLDEMTRLSKEEEQQYLLNIIIKQCTVNDLKMFIRLMKGDLRIGAGAKHILEGVHNDAYDSFNTTRNIVAVIDKVLEVRAGPDPNNTSLSLGASIMQPVQPMLAQACKSIDMAFQKCPNGIYSELKYDGERVQLHKQGKQFKYFSRSLKPVMAHKVKHFSEHIPKAFPLGSDLILDAEVLMVDIKTGKPLPFGTLGIHKGSGFKDASPCLFVFDLLYYNGDNLMDKPIKTRRKMLEEVMVEVGNHVKLSELTHVTRKSQLADQIKTVLDQGLEGLVLKDLKSIYEPGKRHWLKVKKDYLNEGAMADTADLVVLGGWYGTGQKGGMISVFLMGCRDEFSGKWCTVTKVHTGHDDATLERLQRELLPKMDLVKRDFDRVPSWLKITRQMVPDFLAKDPKESPVWEITGAEFSKAEIHTADGISIRFPRVTKIRKDKNFKTATNLQELQHLYTESKNNIDVNIEGGSEEDEKKYKKNNNNDEVKVKEEKNQKRKNLDKNGSSSLDDTPNKKKKVEDEIKEEMLSTNKKVKKEINEFSGDKIKEEVSSSSINIKNEDYEYDSDDKLMMSGEDAIPDSVRNVSTVPNEFRTSNKFSLRDISGDLFQSDDSLAHCISRDYRLGKGIAKLFRENFGNIDELKKSDARLGGLAVFKQGDRFIYNLVTKEKYNEKPTYETLRQSLEAMKEHALTNKVNRISLPRIGCGLDGLSWSAVRTLIKNVFQLENIKITVYTLDSSSDKPRVKSPNRSSQPSVTSLFNKKDKPVMKSPNRTAQPSVTSMFEKKDKLKTKLTDLGFGFKTTKPLPDVFVGIKADLQPGIRNMEELRRHFVAYGGLDERDEGAATHYVYPEGSKKKHDKGSEEVKHVWEQWLVDSIKLMKKQDERLYQIK